MLTRRAAGGGPAGGHGRLPCGVFDHIDGGAEDEVSQHRNAAAFRRVEFRPWVLVGAGTVDPATTLLGRRLPVPIVLAPTGVHPYRQPGGELDVARAAAAARLPYCLSTLATRSIEEVAAVSSGPLVSGLCLARPGHGQELLARAAGAGYEAIVIS